VKNRFQSLPFKINLQRYNAATSYAAAVVACGLPASPGAAVGRCTLWLLYWRTSSSSDWLTRSIGQWEGWMMHVPANEKAVSLNLHRYTAVGQIVFSAQDAEAHRSRGGAHRTLNQVDP
jgi:hypothetical protein